MKSLFNGTCSRCNQLRPRCARVYFGNGVKRIEKILCEDCRKGFKKLKLAEEHR